MREAAFSVKTIGGGVFCATALGEGKAGEVTCAGKKTEERSNKSTTDTQLCTLTAFRAIEDHPDQQVFSEILKTVDLAGGSKERITGTELHAFAFHQKPATACRDNIKFVACVRLLQVSAFGSVDLNGQCAVAEKFRVEFAVACWDGLLRVSQLDDS